MTMPNNDAEQSERVIELRLPSRLGYEKVAMDAASSLGRHAPFRPAHRSRRRGHVAERNVGSLAPWEHRHRAW